MLVILVNTQIVHYQETCNITKVTIAEQQNVYFDV